MQPGDFDRDFDIKSIEYIQSGDGYIEEDSELEGYYNCYVNTIDFVTDSGDHFIVVDLDGATDDSLIRYYICNKYRLGKEICTAARTYWYKRFHREYYQKAIAQWLARELDLPGEVAQLISEFA